MDFLTDEKLCECSAASVGVYIMLMCVLHKQADYGTITLREKDKQTDDVYDNFAAKLVKHLPFERTVIAEALRELATEGVICVEGDLLMQKRMVRDAGISDKRAEAGKKGSAAANAKFDAAKSAAKVEQTPEQNAGESAKAERGVCEEIVGQYNRICTSFPKVRSLSEARKKAIKARLNSGYTVESFAEVFRKAEGSSFLKGKNDRNWQATFDWLIKDSNMAKVIDGNYEDKGGTGRNGASWGYSQPPADGGFKPSGGFKGNG